MKTRNNIVFFAGVVLLVSFFSFNCAGEKNSNTPSKQNLYETDSDGEDAVNCNLAQWAANCKIGCPYGYNNDANGCPVCECRSNPINPYNCTIPTCAKKCEGYKIVDRCMICECGGGGDVDVQQEEVDCNIAGFNASCKIGCPYGYNNDANGCPVCECRSNPINPFNCNIPTCETRCEGYKIVDRCMTCECGGGGDVDVQQEEPECNIADFKTNCAIGCPYGYNNDSNGCPVCECRSNPSNPFNCNIPTCETRCENYKIVDRCMTCECGAAK